MRRSPLMLVVGGEPFDYPHADWGDQNPTDRRVCEWVGSCRDSDWLAAIDAPIVLVTTSSIRQADDILGRVALATLADLPVHVVVTFPAGVPPDLHVPRNATVRQFVPHGPVLDRAVCAVTHGGMGATLRALNRGAGLRRALRT